MSAMNFDQLFKSLETGLESISKSTMKDYEAEAKADGQKALQNMKVNLQQWTNELETGAITREDLAYLLQEDEELTKMVALKQAGLAQIHIDEFRNNVIAMIISKVI